MSATSYREGYHNLLINQKVKCILNIKKLVFDLIIARNPIENLYLSSYNQIKGIKMELNINKISYSIELNREQWDKLDGTDYDIVEKQWLKDTKAQELEWDGHFGSNFFFSIRGYSAEEINEDAKKVLEAMSKNLPKATKNKLPKLKK